MIGIVREIHILVHVVVHVVVHVLEMIIVRVGLLLRDGEKEENLESQFAIVVSLIHVPLHVQYHVKSV